ncbi:hypothetical protein COCCU_05955 [Corynebacterium occultum]|uniref:Uncharacterized protein n=1 Tax=Corynebacterium occultum TaxID=2675219 RepID=A0A6B8W751_9CORY|nr:DUF1611 domain-containing protein [Corynebacterium occultum]QGU07135.1 hypothetical protein COCCU_05955 [Corynebacterium occultum]
MTAVIEPTLTDTTLNSSAACGPRELLPLPSRIQASYTTRFVAEALKRGENFQLLRGADVTPQVGDVVLARVVGINNHKRVETPDSRKAILFEGAVLMLAYGHRYAADQFLAHVPDNLDSCHLVAAGGIAGQVTERHAKIGAPTVIEPLGLLTGDGGVVNLRDFAAYRNDTPVSLPARTARPEVIAVLGTSMNSGKSTTMACLANGLMKSGLRVASGKITGTGAGNDRMIYHDAGSAEVVDFTDYGYPTTFKMDMAAIRDLTINMVVDLTAKNVDVILVEIADGIYQTETYQLLRDENFQAVVDQVVFSATDALGARTGVQELLSAGLPVAAASGVMTSSPLAANEAGMVLAEFGVPVVGTYQLKDAAIACNLLARS